ncbi:MAG: tyrosine-type recombinase/integrase [Chloroflexota bacterium]|nr:tyrosine-type recombinase/integrase [Chloroflexota bacterium]
MLREHRSRRVVVPLRDALVFSNPDGSLDPDGVTGRSERLSRAAGLPRIRLHDLRHTPASLLLASGVPAKVVQERLATRLS